MLIYKFDVLAELKKYGYTTTKLRRERLLGENAIQSLRNGEMVGIKSIDKICALLDMQPGNIIRYIEKNN